MLNYTNISYGSYGYAAQAIGEGVMVAAGTDWLRVWLFTAAITSSTWCNWLRRAGATRSSASGDASAPRTRRCVRGEGAAMVSMERESSA